LIEPVGPGLGGVAAIVSLAPPGAQLATLARPVLVYLFTSGLLLLVFGYVALTRLIVRPLEMLTAATAKVASGRLDVTVPVQGGWEIAAAAQAFNEMTRRLREQQDRLNQKVEELERTAHELRATQNQLIRSAKLASVGSLAAGLAHEVGNPISAILGLSEVLLDGETDANESREYIDRVRREAERVHRIVRDLLDYARPAPTDADGPSAVAEAVDAAVSLLSPQKSYRSVDIQVVGDPSVPPVALGLDQLTQVLVNLMMNAADAVGGEGDVRVGFVVDVIASGDTRATPAVRISVSDSGPGVREDEIPRIFEPFYTTKDPGAGTGLGLALCEGIVTRAGGTIEAHNQPGGGFVVSIALPAAGAATRAEAAPPDPDGGAPAEGDAQ
jgi:signal transduction histidine kinase